VLTVDTYRNETFLADNDISPDHNIFVGKADNCDWDDYPHDTHGGQFIVDDDGNKESR
jgi:hypothetical protein